MGEFHRLTGVPLCWPDVADLPDAFLARASLSPSEILAAGLERLSRRAVNTLRRCLVAENQGGPWTYGRLTRIPGLGFMTLLEVLRLTASLPGQVHQRVPRHTRLEEEFARLLGRSHDLPARTPTPMLDQAVAVIARHLPACEADVLQRLEEAGLVNGSIDIARFERALRYRDPPCPFVFFRRPGLSLVVASDQLARAKLIHGRTLRALTATGPTTVDQAAQLAGTDDLDFVRAVLSARRGVEWLDRGRRRFRIRDMSLSAA